MTEIIEINERPQLTFSQRWNGYLAIALAAVMAFVGITLRNATLNATQTFEDLEAGVRAQLPQGWLVDRQSTDYIFRAQDPDALPFKTILQVSVLPIGEDATPDVVLDLLKMQRAPRLSSYQEISRSSETLRGDPARRMIYAYTQADRNPFQASVQLVVQGVDVVVLRRGQAVIITYREERSAFDNHLYRFENLLQTVEIF
jgi:hypothetical protein